jgi:ubiquinone/menaquinone biosynthesis C-methylase UbiE
MVSFFRRAFALLVSLSLTESLSNDVPTTRRSLLWKLPVGASSLYAYGRLAYTAFSVRGIQYPQKHEDRVRSTLETALFASLDQSSPNHQPLRVLEVGIGKDLRLFRRGLYDQALQRIESTKIQIVGLDLVQPDRQALNDARDRAREHNVDLSFVQGSITSPLDYPDGYFDAVICCLTLCSVDDPTEGIQECKRLLKTGGCFGWAEHVAVDPDEPYRFLEIQQQLLDPLQRAVANNCHLHRYSEQTIAQVFDLDQHPETLIAHDRFLVDQMWPVCCQCCGVIRKI